MPNKWEESRSDFARNLAVVIGIDCYKSDNIHDLSTPVSDAIALADLLEKKYGYKPENVCRLINEQAILTRLQSLLNATLPNQLKPTKSDRLILYFAGHGLPKNSDKGPSGYLAPQDAELGQEKSFLPMSEVYDALEKLQCHHLLVILDCCFAGTFRWASSRKLIAILETIHREHYDRFIRYPAWQVITSSAHDQEALDFVKLSEDRRGNPIQVNNEKHSPFALALLEALQDDEPDRGGRQYQNADYTRDGVITAHELFLYLSDRVSKLSKDRQVPGLYPLQREYDKGEFIFVQPGFDPKQLSHAPELNEENNPYRGLKPFEERHANLFFGRQKLVEELNDRLTKSSCPLTVVLGTSGSGKSSLVKAGLLPYLRQKQEKEKLAQRWYLLNPMRPGKSPLTELARVLLPLDNSNLIAKLAQVSFLDKTFAKIFDPKSKQESKAFSQKLTSSGDRSLDETRLAERWYKATLEAKLLLVIDYCEQLKSFCHQPQEEAQLTSFYEEIKNSLDALIQTLQQKPQSFNDLMTTWSQANPNTKLLLVIDQFEELITMSQDDLANEKQSDFQGQDEQKEWQRFLSLLRIALAKYRRHLRVIVTLRSDFEPRFLNSALKVYWKNARFPVRAMNSDELRDAIEGPALKQALCFEPPELVGKLIDEVGQMPGALPLLSFTLSELYIKLYQRWTKDRSTDRALRIKDYEELGGVAGALTRRATEEYDNFIKDFGEESGKAYQATMKRVMLRMVAIEGGGVARRRVPEAELVYPDAEENKRVAQVSDRLVKARLLVKGQETGETYIEPAHDFLVRGWDKLQEWVKEEQVNLALRQRLTPQASDWYKATIANSEKDEQAVGLLWNNDPRLDQLKEICESAIDNWLNKWETEFVQSSLARKQTIEKDLREQLKQEKKLRITAELREQAARVENLLSVNPKEALELAVQAVDQNLQNQKEGLLDRLLTPVQFSLNKAMEVARLPNIFIGHESEVTSVAFSPNNRLIASASYDGTIRLWDLTGNPACHPFKGEPSSGINSISFSPDGQLIIGGCKDGSIRLWNLEGEPISFPCAGHQGFSVNSVVFSPDGKLIASGSDDQTICLWNLKGESIGDPFIGHKEIVTSITFSPDSKQIVSGSKDGTVRLWNLNGSPVGQPFEQGDWVSSV
ncbi:MAG: caspase family protein [Hydrococcus sp. Prado102]|jgi:hypothetical protein|nr:caspase family protein [Hydrococcus sp. Prado102]